MKLFAFSVCSVFVCLAYAPSALAQAGGQPEKAKCEAQCAAYKQFLKTEAAEVAAVKPQPRYVPIDSKEPVLRVRLLNTNPEVDHPVPSVDDELRVYVGGNEVWSVSYGSPNNKPGTEFVLTADKLPLRNSNIILRWRNTAGPDAHFFVELGGSLVCPTDGWCGQTYREGLTFGPKRMLNPIVGLIPPPSEIDFVNGWVWRSSIDRYPSSCEPVFKCQ